MPPTCQSLTQEYQSLLEKKRQFDALLETAEIAKTPEEAKSAIASALALKHELTEGKAALENKLNPLESVFHTKEQYEKEKKMLADYGTLEIKNGQEGITGMDENEGETFYPYPSLATIRSLIRENGEMLKRKSGQGFVPWYIIPFAKKLDALLDTKEHALQKHFSEGKLYRTKKDQNDPNEALIPITEFHKDGPLYRWDKYKNADASGDLVYHPKSFDENHNGKTKQELVKESLSSKIPGYSLIFLEDMPNIPREGKGKEIGGRKQIDTGGSSIMRYIDPKETTPSSSEYLVALQKDPQYENESGMTPEEAIILDLAFLHEYNQILDDYQGGNGSLSYHLGAYFKEGSGVVPGSYWFADVGGRAFASWNVSELRTGYCGVRPVVRIPQKSGTA